MRRFKILILGDSGVGKSSLVLRWTEDRYMATLVGTVGVNFKSKKVSINGETIHVQAWDTAGQQQFHKITTSYYRGSHGIMVVYDVSDPESLANVGYWIKNIKTHASENVRVVLVGNKTDLRRKEAEIGENHDKMKNSTESIDSNTSLAATIADEFEVPYFETSALDSHGCDDAFMNVARFCVGVEDGNVELLKVPSEVCNSTKPSMISRMMGRRVAAPQLAKNSTVGRTQASSEAKRPEGRSRGVRKKCIQM
eukprot:GSChrysophyteH1.ASY1.ANO1.2535.1 assembled CDS